jgi:hypothetical protein
MRPIKLFEVGDRAAPTDPIRTRNAGDSITVNAGASRKPGGLGRRVHFSVFLGICLRRLQKKGKPFRWMHDSVDTLASWYPTKQPNDPMT